MYNIIYFYGKDKTVFGDCKGVLLRQNSTIKNGDVVTTKVDVENGWITWEINGKPQQGYQMERLKNKEKEWVPYLSFADNGDVVEWLD